MVSQQVTSDYYRSGYVVKNSYVDGFKEEIRLPADPANMDELRFREMMMKEQAKTLIQKQRVKGSW